jgi:hypothetical protein
MRRRSYLALAGLAATGTLAGCSGGDDSGDNGNDSPDNEAQSGESNTDNNATDDTEDESDTEDGEPTGRADIVVTEVRPDSAALNEPFAWEIEFTNQGDAEGERSVDVYRALTAGPEPTTSQWRSNEDTIRLSPGESTTLASDEFSIEQPSILYLGVDERVPEYEIQIPASRAPIITDGALVTEWSEFGDLEANRIESVSVGELITLAARYWYYVEGRLQVFRTWRIFDSDGDRVRIQNTDGEQLFDQVGWRQFEFAQQFDTTGLSAGSYTVELVLEDEQSGAVSNAYEFEFELI